MESSHQGHRSSCSVNHHKKKRRRGGGRKNWAAEVEITTKGTRARARETETKTDRPRDRQATQRISAQLSTGSAGRWHALHVDERTRGVVWVLLHHNHLPVCRHSGGRPQRTHAEGQAKMHTHTHAHAQTHEEGKRAALIDTVTVTGVWGVGCGHCWVCT